MCKKRKNPSESLCSISLSHRRKNTIRSRGEDFCSLSFTLDTCAKTGVAPGKYLAENIALKFSCMQNLYWFGLMLLNFVVWPCIKSHLSTEFSQEAEHCDVKEKISGFQLVAPTKVYGRYPVGVIYHSPYLTQSS